MTSHHRLDSGTVWPLPDPEVQWRLRYGSPTRADCLVAAAVMATWAHVLDPTVEAEPVVRAIRELRGHVRTMQNAPTIEETP